jgi:hypothetical protein
MDDFELLRQEYGMPRDEKFQALQEDLHRMKDDLFSIAEALGVQEEFGGGLAAERIVLAIEALKEKAGMTLKVASHMIKVSKILTADDSAQNPDGSFKTQNAETMDPKQAEFFKDKP